MSRCIIYLIHILIFVSCKPSYKVEWISSTNESAWEKQAELIPFKTTDKVTPSLIVLPEQEFQTIDGFGGCFNEMGWVALSTLSQEKRDTILYNIFDQENGLKFNICRMPIGASDYAVNWYSLNDTEDDFDMSEFSIERDEKYLIPYIEEAMKFRPDLKIWGSPWSPPVWMKTNHYYACRPGEVNELDPAKEGKEGITQFIMEKKYLDAYALYFSKYVKAYRDLGVDIYAVHVQNEPNSCQVFPSCIWTAGALNTFIGQYLGPRMQEDFPDIEIWYGTIERPYIENIDTVLQDEASSVYVDGLGFQWAGKKAIPMANTKYPDIKKMQTESECGDGSNDWAAAEYTFSLMKHYFEHGVNSYLYWNMALEQGGYSNWGWKQNALISIDTVAKSVTYNPEFYLMKHLSYYVQPGAKRVALEGMADNALAFKNPDGEIVVIYGNTGESDKNLTIKLHDEMVTGLVKAKSFNTLVIPGER